MVTRSALQNAASIAKNILTTEAIVAEVPEKDGGGGGGGMPDMSRDDVATSQLTDSLYTKARHSCRAFVIPAQL